MHTLRVERNQAMQNKKISEENEIIENKNKATINIFKSIVVWAVFALCMFTIFDLLKNH